MTARIRDFLRRNADDGPAPRRRPRRRARQLPDLREGFAGHARVLRREGEPGARGAVAARLARLVLRHRLGRRDRDGARGRRHAPTASPSATRSRRSATSRAPTRSACASSRSTARPRSRRSRARRPARRVFCRILSDCVGAEWPLSRKFGCEPAMAVDVLEHAMKLGLEPYGVSFHVGSQQRNPHAWDRALASAAAVFRECGDRGMRCRWSTSAAASRPST